MEPVDLVRLRALTERTTGRSEIRVGLIDGPVDLDHPELATEHIHTLPGRRSCACSQTGSVACEHGTYVAGILMGRRGSAAPSICPGCTVLVRPVFHETSGRSSPAATPVELAQAIQDCVAAGAHVLNISAALLQFGSTRGEQALTEALDYAAQRGVLAIVAAGNQSALGSTAITRHPWVLPVVAYDRDGRPMEHSNLGHSIGRRGLGAPGEAVISLAPGGGLLTSGGTSASAAFVSGTAALLLSEFPDASPAAIRFALTWSGPAPRRTVVPPLLDAAHCWAFLQGQQIT